MPWERHPTLTKADIAATRRDLKKTSFLVDESVDLAVAVAFRLAGFKAVHVSEIGLDGHSDEDVFARAWREDRVILTHDADSLNDRAFPPQRNPGAVLLPGTSGTRNTLPDILTWIARTIGRSRSLWLRTEVVFFGDGSWAVHTFEKDEGRIVSTRYRRRAGRLEIWD